MILSSVTYLIFVAVCLILHDLLPRRFRNLWLLLVSVGFFLYAMPAQMPILMLFCLAVFGIGHILGKAPEQIKKIWLILGVGVCVGFLVFYKYLGFLAGLLGLPAENGIFSLVVPIGISYVTFQCISYLVEVYKGRLAPEENPVDFLIYCLFFAKLTAGPIEAPGAFLAQLKQERACTPGDARKGIFRILMGFVKKIAVADFAAVGVNAVFAAGEYTGWSVILAGVLYAVQIFFDFSGYTDIARGSAALFGIELTENFNSPYSATSVRDFWRRWHISLSTWLRNYIYIPLGGSRVGTARRYLNILITFLVSGIWHGASWTFVFWGLLHGLYQMAVSVVSWRGLLNLGFGSGYLRCYSRYRAAGEDQEIARLNGMFLLIFSAMSLLCLLCGGVLSAHAETVFGADLTAEELGRARRLLGLLVGNLALNLLNTVFDCHITARERFMFQKLLRLAQTLLSPFLTLPLLVMGHASDAVAGVSLVPSSI